MQNIRGGAALLRDAYLKTFPDDPALSEGKDLARWYQPVAAYFGSSDKAATRNYADHVFGSIKSGIKSRPGAQIAAVAAHAGLVPVRGAWQSVPSDYEIANSRRLKGLQMPDIGSRGAKLAAPFVRPLSDFNGDQWAPSPNFGWQYIGQHGRPTALIEVVIHTCQGLYSGCLSTLQNNSVPLDKRVSAHFLVRSSDGWRAKLVSVDDVAWHALSHNNYSMGIEHEGWAGQGYQYYNATMYRQSSWLTAWACYLYYFGCDLNHVVGHSSFQPEKPDPGPYWDWNYYMTCVYWRLQFIQYGYPPQTCY